MIYINGKLIGFDTFPNKETKMREDEIVNAVGGVGISGGMNEVTFKYTENSDLIHLLFVKMFLDRWGWRSKLHILYMPYSRMDRTKNDSAFTLKYVANFINSLSFQYVTVVEPHSDVTPALIDRCIVQFPTVELINRVMDKVGFDPSSDLIIYPDQGASKRYSDMIAYPYLTANKQRNFETGRIEKIEVVSNGIDCTGRKAIIVDDLCSYGGTFVGVAEQLRELGFSEIYLLVAHTEFSIFKGHVFPSGLIDKVFTTNSIIDEDVMKGNNPPPIEVFDIIKLEGSLA